jgi:hypothetical protein
LDPVFVALNRSEPALGWALAERARRAEDYTALGARVVELHRESHAAKPSSRAWAITRRTDRALQAPPRSMTRAGTSHLTRLRTIV